MREFKDMKKFIGWIFALGCIMAFVGCGAQLTLKTSSVETTPLAEDELAYFNGDSFFNGEYLNIRNQFLSSLYEEPGDIDLFGLFYCGSGITETITEDELTAVMAKSGIEGSIEDLPCPCEKISRSNMDKILKEYMDLTLADTNKIGLENFVYLQEYDAYYFFHGDTNYRGNIKFFGGERKNDIIWLFYDDEFFGDGRKVLTLREKNGAYLFVANQISGDPISETQNDSESAAEYSFVFDKSMISLGSTEWELPFQLKNKEEFPSDIGDKGTRYDYGDFTVKTVSFEDQESGKKISRVLGMTSVSDKVETLRGIKVTDTLNDLKEAYPKDLYYLETDAGEFMGASYDEAYGFVPDDGTNRYIKFCLNHGIIVGIEIEDLIDGRLHVTE